MDYRSLKLQSGYSNTLGQMSGIFVQGIWDIFKELKDNSDRMYRHASGIAPKSIPVRPVLDLQGRQVAEGGYYPIIAHPEFEGTSKKLMGKDPLFF